MFGREQIPHLVNMLRQLDELSGKSIPMATGVVSSVVDGVVNISKSLSGEIILQDGHKLYIGILKGALMAPNEQTRQKLIDAADGLQAQYDFSGNVRESLKSIPQHPLDAQTIIAPSAWWRLWMTDVVDLGVRKGNDLETLHAVVSRVNVLGPQVGQFNDPSGLLKSAEYDYEVAAKLLKHYVKAHPGEMDMKAILRSSPTTWQKTVAHTAFPQLKPDNDSSLDR